MSTTPQSGPQSRTAATIALSQARCCASAAGGELAQGYDTACVSLPIAPPAPTDPFLEPPAFADLLVAIEAGRAGRGRSGTAWSQLRARVLAYTGTGMLRARIAGVLGYSTQRVTQLREEGCEAVLRGELPSREADTVCRTRWQRWCYAGDANACARVASTAEPEAG